MGLQKRALFREKSLQRLSDPEKLDEAMRIVAFKDWVLLGGFAVLVGGILLWSVYGSIPATVYGRGVILRPRTVVPFAAPSSGYFIAAKMRTGQVIKPGQVLGVIAQPEMQSKLQQMNLRLRQLLLQNRLADQLENRQAGLDSSAVEEKRHYLQQSLKDGQALAATLKKQFDSLEQLRKQQLVTDTVYSQAQEGYIRKLGDLSSLKTQLAELEGQKQALVQRSFQNRTGRQAEIQQLQSDINATERNLWSKSQIISQHRGRILTISTNLGTFVNEGQSLGTIQRLDVDSDMVTLAYFRSGDGKRIQRGMRVQVSPDSVERERYGSILAGVYSVAEYPVSAQEVSSLVGKEDLANALVKDNRNIQLVAELSLDRRTFSGFRWTTSSGPPLKISTATPCDVQVTLEDRSPLSFVIPFLKSLTGVR